MPVYLWQKLPAPNATADNTINLQAGRSPSAITPADRATLAAIAQWRDDLAGSLISTVSHIKRFLAVQSACPILVLCLNGRSFARVDVSNTQRLAGRHANPGFYCQRSDFERRLILPSRAACS